jgi:hypothetical protein
MWEGGIWYSKGAITWSYPNARSMIKYLGYYYAL